MQSFGMLKQVVLTENSGLWRAKPRWFLPLGHAERQTLSQYSACGRRTEGRIVSEWFQTFPKKSFIEYFEMYELDVKPAGKHKDIIFLASFVVSCKHNQCHKFFSDEEYSQVTVTSMKYSLKFHSY
jgi:hypothetical protein